MSTIVQEIDFKTKNGLLVKAQIEKINNLEYICNVHADNAKGSFSTLPSSTLSSAKECFETLLNQINKIIFAQYIGDSLEKIDNTCNCPYITKKEEEIICTSSITILVNGS
ncbi:MAG: hypothetical protein A3E21_04310 [Sulfurimonas sp. RIFCSPHIGHO2_12_FULL_36_9]|uniref:hypothetical protein n=1 Tax=Sulfurimonas sp. RIFCSPLOWO2_12_36_12 TaxID=1802253 RepID=UPI0008D501C2|nr:hypothetical protein [Sulfurimonas sp. RIFCSPLOWO2_12_36_12]OHD98650.1 MAG: hypothetical protein A3E21_04310 [Sulfurimonas sp. RIFCSPHIGHO2_12_FULL_36_9]OHE00415.1 MAG: hypothetical protein A2W82_03810 [Sulfurimonas sp. RIFCSPLOWO2_12_36_12]OHE05274.1 MAG: hypothetical protein A3K14_07320 [Sulfurimonas sp. RIFCSPLOWO2_12_FULL_36_74]